MGYGELHERGLAFDAVCSPLKPTRGLVGWCPTIQLHWVFMAGTYTYVHAMHLRILLQRGGKPCPWIPEVLDILKS